MADSKRSSKKVSSSKKKSSAKRPAGKRASAPKGSSKASKGPAGAKSGRAKSDEHGPVCSVTYCPICQAAKATQGAGPEAFGHLLAAAREFFLAAKVVMEAMPNDAAPWRTGEASEGSESSGAEKSARRSGVRSKLQKISVS